MYFKNRAEAGRALAAKLTHYEHEQCAVIALSDGGVLVGAQIAIKLRAKLMTLLSSDVVLPGELDTLASMTSDTFTYNQKFSDGERDDMVSEYRGIIDAQRLENFHKLNVLLSDGGSISVRDLNHHVVILVTDALQDGMVLDVAYDFLKPTKLIKLVIATPLASVDAVDRMHLIGDEIYCLSVADHLMEANHYYDDNIVPNHEGILKIIRLLE